MNGERALQPPSRWRRYGKYLFLLLLTTPFSLFVIDHLFFQGSGHPPPHLQVKGLFPKKPIKTGRFALVINGALSPAKNHARYWNNTSLVYCTLKSLGWEQVRVLQSDGLSTEPDRQRRSFIGIYGTGDLLDSPTDLDNDGQIDVQGAATIANIKNQLSDMGKLMVEQDTLFIVLTDHGQLRWDRGNLRSVAMLWGEECYGRQLQEWIKTYIPPGVWVCVLATQCHGQIFLDEFNRENTVLMASGWPLWIWSDQDYSVFPYRFCEALLGRSPMTGGPLKGASRKDGSISFGLAFKLACQRDHVPEWPQRRIVGNMANVPKLFQ